MQVSIAGEVAVEILTGTVIDWGEWLDHPDSDINLYNELAERLGWHERDGTVKGLGPVMEERVAEVRDLLVERWAAVEAIAAALLRKDEISGEDAIRIMSETGVPGPVASVWADLLEERRTEAEMRARLSGSENPIAVDGRCQHGKELRSVWRRPFGDKWEILGQFKCEKCSGQVRIGVMDEKPPGDALTSQGPWLTLNDA